jgi:hypothetical protein
MVFKVDNSILWDNVFFIETDSGVKYVAKLEETSPESGVWALYFLLLSGIPNSREIFGTMNTLSENLIDVLNQKGINSLLVWINGEDRKEIDQKTKVFLRWVEYPFEYTLDENPEIRIQGKNDVIYPNTNFIHIRRVNQEIEKVEEQKIQTVHTETISNNKIRFCFNCGEENKDYKFCPGCGTNLKQT